MDVYEYDFAQGKARAIEVNLKPEVKEAMRWDHVSVTDTNFITGEQLTNREVREHQRQYERNRQASITTASGPTAELLQTINSTSRIAFERSIDLDHAREIVRHPGVCSDEDYCSHVERQLDYVEQVGAPIYVQAENSPRLYAIGTSLNSVPREVRKAAFRGCNEFDLKSAQLAIVARVYNLPELTEFLESRQSIWQVLWADCYNHEQFDIAKNKIKEFLYALIFGMSRRNLLSGDKMKDPPDEIAREKLLKHARIAELLKWRNRESKKLENDNGGHNAFGQWIDNRWENEFVQNIRSTLCQIVQSYEVRIMMELLPIIGHRSVHVVSWLHDGLTIYFADASKQDRWIRQMQERVNSYCASHGYLTQLEHTELDD